MFGYSGSQTVVNPGDAGSRYYESDSGWIPEPHIFQESENSKGHPGVGFGFTRAYEATGDKFLKRAAKSLGDTLVSAQRDNKSGGWWYDMGVVGYDRQPGSPTYRQTLDYRRWVNYFPWGGHGNVMDRYQNLGTLDGVSYLCGYFLLRLYQALPPEEADRGKYLASAKWLADTIVAFKDVEDPDEQFLPDDPQPRGLQDQSLPGRKGRASFREPPSAARCRGSIDTAGIPVPISDGQRKETESHGGDSRVHPCRRPLLEDCGGVASLDRALPYCYIYTH